MHADDLLSQMTIPTPCRQDWSTMSGDQRVRHCAACGKHVYNFSMMTSSQTLALIYSHQGGQLCARVYRRPDGTVVTSDCPPAPVSTGNPWQFRIRHFMAFVAGIAAALGLAKSFPERPVPRTLVSPPILTEEQARPIGTTVGGGFQGYMMGMVMSPSMMKSLANTPGPGLGGECATDY